MLALTKNASHPLIATALQHYELLHSEQRATVLLWDKQAKKRQWTKISAGESYAETLNAQDSELDRYLSPNEFFGWRKIALLAELRALYVDIDHCTDEELVLSTVAEAGLPAPSALVHSGNGIHLYWIHQAQPRWMLPQWQQAQDRLCDILRAIGADPAARDCSRVLRLVGSVNSKGGKSVRGLLFDAKKYEFLTLIKSILSVPAPEKEGKKGSKKGRAVPSTAPAVSEAVIRDLNAARARTSARVPYRPEGGRSAYDRWFIVYQDLLTIGRYYPAGVPEGYRNVMLHLAAVALSWYTHIESLKDELSYLAQLWAPKLTASEIASILSNPLQRAQATQQARQKGLLTEESETRYRYRRETLYKKLRGLITEELELELRAIISEDLRSQRRKERDAQRDRSGRYKTSHKNSQNKAEPWQPLGISRSHYFRLKKAGKLPAPPSSS